MQCISVVEVIRILQLVLLPAISRTFLEQRKTEFLDCIRHRCIVTTAFTAVIHLDRRVAWIMETTTGLYRYLVDPLPFQRQVVGVDGGRERHGIHQQTVETLFGDLFVEVKRQTEIEVQGTRTTVTDDFLVCSDHLGRLNLVVHFERKGSALFQLALVKLMILLGDVKRAVPSNNGLVVHRVNVQTVHFTDEILQLGTHTTDRQS